MVKQPRQILDWNDLGKIFDDYQIDQASRLYTRTQGEITSMGMQHLNHRKLFFAEWGSEGRK
jgi:hypothetical protein